MRLFGGEARQFLLGDIVLAALEVARRLLKTRGGLAAAIDLVIVNAEPDRDDNNQRGHTEKNLGHMELEEERRGFKDALKLVGLLELFASYLVAGRQLSLHTRPVRREGAVPANLHFVLEIVGR